MPPRARATHPPESASTAGSPAAPGAHVMRSDHGPGHRGERVLRGRFGHQPAQRDHRLPGHLLGPALERLDQHGLAGSLGIRRRHGARELRHDLAVPRPGAPRRLQGTEVDRHRPDQLPLGGGLVGGPGCAHPARDQGENGHHGQRDPHRFVMDPAALPGSRRCARTHTRWDPGRGSAPARRW
jgi:hypothetical protein